MPRNNNDRIHSSVQIRMLTTALFAVVVVVVDVVAVLGLDWSW